MPKTPKLNGNRKSAEDTLCTDRIDMDNKVKAIGTLIRQLGSKGSESAPTQNSPHFHQSRDGTRTQLKVYVS